MDAFFASIEQKDNPLFRGKPLIVGGRPQSRGVVAACSYEARRYGIHSAMPCAKAARLCPRAIFTRPRMARYREVSAEVMKIFRQYTHLVEPLSLDEAFLDVTVNSQNHPSATLLARTICSHIYHDVGLTASAGVSFNKFLAKVASDIRKPAGITTVTPEEGVDFLAGLPIRKFFGVGRVTEQKMLGLGIKTGHDLRQWELEKLILHFGKIGSFLHDIVRGIDTRPVQPERTRKSIGSEQTLPYDTNDMDEINAILRTLAKQIEKSLKGKKLSGQTLTLKVRYHDFTTITRSHTIRHGIRADEDIIALLPRLLASTQAGSLKIRLLGLSVSKLSDGRNSPRQLLLPFMVDNPL